MKRFYVYEHWRPDKDTCFYVGKGSGKRAWAKRHHNRHHQNIVGKLARLGMCVEVRLVHSDLEEDAAFALESDRIAFWRESGVKLVNKTNGGEGPSGFKMSEAHQAKLLAANKGKHRSPEIRQKISNSLRGHGLSEEGRKKISAANTGRKKTDPELAKLRAAQTRVMASPQARANVRAKNLGRKLSVEQIQRLRTIRIGRPHSEEARAKIRAARKLQIMKPVSQETREKISAARRRAVVPGFA